MRDYVGRATEGATDSVAQRVFDAMMTMKKTDVAAIDAIDVSSAA